MTDNSDFMSRYLPSESSEQHREHAAPVDDRTEEVSLSDLRLRGPAAPQPPQVLSPQLPPVGTYEFAPPPGQGGRTQGVWPPGPDPAPRAASGEPCLT